MKKLYILFFSLLVLSLSSQAQKQKQEVQQMNGFYWLVSFPLHMDDDDQKFQQYVDYIRNVLSTNEYLNGITIYADWNRFELKKGVYDKKTVARLDAVVQAARDYGKKYKIAWSSGRKAPWYLYNEGVPYIQTVIGNPHNRNYGDTIRIPVPWDKVYLENYYRNIQWLADRYNSDNHFVGPGIAVAVSYSPEWMIVHNPEEAKLWAKYPDKIEKVTNVWKDAIDYFAKTFPDKHISIHASSIPFPGMEAAAKDIIQYACDRLHTRITMQIDQLQGNLDMINSPNYRRVYDYRNQMHSGFQSLSSWKYPEASKRFGPMEMVVYNYVQADGNYWEFWEGDGQSKETLNKVKDMIEHARSIGLARYKQELEQKGQYLPPRNVKK